MKIKGASNEKDMNVRMVEDTAAGASQEELNEKLVKILI